MGYDLSTETDRKLLADKIAFDIERYCEEVFDDGPRSHLGASLIGEPCMRKLWYTFRWVKHKKFSGRMYRLFNRGHKEEARFCEWLRGIDIRVDEFDENGDQFRVSGVDGHYGGSMDGIANLMKQYGVEDSLILEFKTSATGRVFNDLRTFGVKHSKPRHFAQMSTYGMKRGIRYALYMVVNKNDDDLHIEIVELDHEYAKDLESKAEVIITSQTEPDRLHSEPSHFDCKYCDYKNVCFNDEPLDRNCRSCKHCIPIENANWKCLLYDNTVPKDFIAKGCDKWEGVC